MLHALLRLAVGRLAAAVLATAVVAVLASPASARADDAPPAVPVEVAPGVWAFLGASGEPSAENRGRVANGGFVIGERGVAVIDTGVSWREGDARLAAIRRITSRPITWIVITRATQEFLFGTGAFAIEGATVVTHEKSAALMRERCEHCLSNLRQIVGETEMERTVLLVPERLATPGQLIDLGNRRLQLLHPGWASTPGDLLVIDMRTRTLFGGGTLANRHVPDLRDADLGGWIAALDEIERIRPLRIVPGFGPPMTLADVKAQRGYLVALDERVRDLYAMSTSLMEAVDQAALPVYDGWAGYATVHRKNAQTRYLQLEVDDLQR
ncbi:MAG: MBL fold metallo-hydrolase [Burkholderiales bacterium]|jgi:glyoxylase-like metal-dependent hydrolase (beta-lactamase superfamily II)|nr:MBL fold metallo-hydrolase [Burkholderiales bacterium]